VLGRWAGDDSDVVPVGWRLEMWYHQLTGLGWGCACPWQWAEDVTVVLGWAVVGMWCGQAGLGWGCPRGEGTVPGAVEAGLPLAGAGDVVLQKFWAGLGPGMCTSWASRLGMICHGRGWAGLGMSR